MDTRVIKASVIRPVRDTTDYADLGGKINTRIVSKFDKRFLRPMREHLKKSLRRMKEFGAESIMEIGPGEGTGLDISITEGLTRLSAVEINPATVKDLERKYSEKKGNGSVTIYLGDVRDVLSGMPDKSQDIGLIFDNTFSNMQEPVTGLDAVKVDFRHFVLSELLRISTKAVLVGVSGVELTPVYLEVFGNGIRWTSDDQKTNIFHDGLVTQRYDDADVASLLSNVRAKSVKTVKDRNIYWCEITP